MLLFTITKPACAIDLTSKLKNGHGLLQFGGYWSEQGREQHININGLIGDDFTVTNAKSNNGLVGLGYFVKGQERDRWQMTYGINAFYLAKTAVTGTIIQENLFTNLAYTYNVTHYPIYAVAKSSFKTPLSNNLITLDAGIGPNIMQTGAVQERSLDKITVPDHVFSGRTTTAFSATLGLGVKINHVIGDKALELGYRFFYLGQGSFNRETNQVINTLNTGNNYANALVCSFII